MDYTLSEPVMTNTNLESQKPKRKRRKGDWRLSILATPRVFTPKYEKPVDTLESGVRPEALKAPLNKRNDQMSIPPLRLLYINKRAYAGNPNTHKQYAEIMDKHIEAAWNSIYNEYKKARRDKRLQLLAGQPKRYQKLKAKAKKGRGKGKEKPAKKGKDEKEDKKDRGDKKGKEAKTGKSGKKGKAGKKEKAGKEKGGKGEKKVKVEDVASLTSEDIEKQIQEWVDKRSQPKKIPEPEPINRGRKANLTAMKERIDAISTPSRAREKYVPEPPPKHIVKESALKYEATERILEIAKPTRFRLAKQESIHLGSVRPAALKYKTTERDTRLATPRARANANDADVKEDPFSISKNALKYKATPRIIELAKPTERK